MLEEIQQIRQSIHSTELGCVLSKKKTGNQINQFAERSIRQAIYVVEKEIERVVPKIIKGAIEEIYKTPFCLLQSFGKKISTVTGKKFKKTFKKLKTKKTLSRLLLQKLITIALYGAFVQQIVLISVT